MSRRCAARTTADELDLAGATARLRDPAQWHAFVDALFETDWVVYAKPAFGGAPPVLRYLGRYTHRVAISNHRLIAFDGERVTFRWKDYAHDDQRRTMTLTAMEFLRRFVQHVLPRGFVRIRQFGYLANACRTARLALARTLLATAAGAAHPRRRGSTTPPRSGRCPRCGAPMIIGPILTARQLATRRSRLRYVMMRTDLATTVALVRRVRARHGDRVSRRGLASARHAATPARRAIRRAACRRRSRVAGPSLGSSPTPGIPTCSSIAGRRASGFLQVSLSKVPRHQHRAPVRPSRAEALPMNASDQAGPIRPAALCDPQARSYPVR